MAKYIGRKNEAYIPKQLEVQSQEIADSQRYDWARTLIREISADDLLARNLENEANEIYIFDDKGKLTPAIGEGEKLTDRHVSKRLLERAQSGQLFIRALGEKGLRQVTTDANYNIGLSKEIGDETTFPKVEIPEKPKRPFFLKYLVPFAFRKEIDAYNAKKAEYDEAVKRDKWAKNFETPENKKILGDAFAKEEEGYGYTERFEKKQTLRQKEIEAEIEKELVEKERMLKEQLVKDDSKLEAEKLRDQQKQMSPMDSAMRKGVLALGHPDLAQGTGYHSYEELLQELNNGEHVSYRIRNGAQNFLLSGMERGTEPTKASEALANVLKTNNQWINRYTPEDPMFRTIARINEEILGLLEDKNSTRYRADLEKLGIRQEDLDLAGGVVEVDRMYQKSMDDKIRGLERLAEGKPISPEYVAGAMTGGVVYALAGAGKAKAAENNSPNPFYVKMGEAKRNIPMSKGGNVGATYDDVKNAIWVNRDFQSLVRGKEGRAALDLLKNTAWLRKEGMRITTTGDIGKKLGMVEKPMEPEQVQQKLPEKKNITNVVK